MDLPRWVQMPFGLVFGLLALLLGVASVLMLFMPNKDVSAFAKVFWGAVLLVCLWLLEKSFRLLTGSKNKGGLMTPNTLRVFSLCMLIVPIACIFAGFHREMSVGATFQAVFYFFGFLRLQALARKREADQSQAHIEIPERCAVSAARITPPAGGRNSAILNP